MNEILSADKQHTIGRDRYPLIFHFFTFLILYFPSFNVQWCPVERTQSVPTARSFYEMFVLRNMIFHRLVRKEKVLQD